MQEFLTIWKRKTTWFYLAVVVVAFGLRFWQLGDYPYGIYSDESFSALEAIETWEKKQFKVFYERNGGREGGHLWIFAILHGLFEPGRWTMRLGVALLGFLSVVFWGSGC